MVRVGVVSLKGALLLQQSSDNHAEAERCFQQAIVVAQNQQAKSWELRAATSLARLWHQQGKREEAQQVLSDIYGWFTEGLIPRPERTKALLHGLEDGRYGLLRDTRPGDCPSPAARESSYRALQLQFNWMTPP